jgi:ABC-2 type transport system ATP-binding protein
VVLNEAIKNMRRNYLSKKIIDIKYNETVNGENKNLNIIKGKGNALKVQVETSKENIDEVLNTLIKLGKVNDITISELPLEDIISYIYKQGTGGDEYACNT